LPWPQLYLNVHPGRVDETGRKTCTYRRGSRPPKGEKSQKGQTEFVSNNHSGPKAGQWWEVRAYESETSERRKSPGFKTSILERKWPGITEEVAPNYRKDAGRKKNSAVTSMAGGSTPIFHLWEGIDVTKTRFRKVPSKNTARANQRVGRNRNRSRDGETKRKKTGVPMLGHLKRKKPPKTKGGKVSYTREIQQQKPLPCKGYGGPRAGS